MNIRLVNEYRVEAELSDGELEELGVSFEKLDYSSVETRRALWCIIDEIRDSGIDVDLSGKVLIEAGLIENGCLISFSVLPPRGNRSPSVKQLIKDNPYASLSCGSFELLRRAAGFLKRGACAALYAVGEGYCLLVKDCDEEELLRAGEFCSVSRRVDAYAAAALEEYGSIMDINALLR